MSKTTETQMYGEVFSRLSKIEIGHLIERKGGLDYLSWSRAWAIVSSVYPGTTYEYSEFPSPVDGNTRLGCLIYPGGSAEVECTVNLLHPSGTRLSQTVRLHIMDHKNKAITEPNTRDVSDTKARCLVKTLAMFGLGLNLWAGDVVVNLVDDDGSTVEDLINETAEQISISMDEAAEIFQNFKKKHLNQATKQEFLAFRNWLVENHGKGKK